jgi:hypothetical protein
VRPACRLKPYKQRADVTLQREHTGFMSLWNRFSLIEFEQRPQRSRT